MEENYVEKGTLKTGVFYEGAWHRDFEIEARRAIHQVDAMPDPLAGKSEYHLGLAILACQITRLGEIPREAIDATLLGELFEDDLEIIQKSRNQVEERIKFFREQTAGSEDLDPADGEDDRVVRAAPTPDANGKT